MERCSTALVPSCPTSTRQQTLFMDRRGWPSQPMVMWQWQTREITASKCTATCSRGLKQPSSPLRQLMDSTGCGELSNTAFQCAHKLISWMTQCLKSILTPSKCASSGYFRVGYCSNFGDKTIGHWGLVFESVDGIK